MKNLVQRLVNGVVAVGLATCVSCDFDQTESESKPNIYPATVEVPVSVGYETVEWDNAYFTAITGARPDEIFLSSLVFESYLKGNDGIKVRRDLTPEEIDRLNIKTPQDLTHFLNDKCKERSGYMGPNTLQ